MVSYWSIGMKIMPRFAKFCMLWLIGLQIQALGVLTEFTHFDHQNMIDARAGGMGGTYIALSDTLTGSYYNPAGLAFIDYKRTTESNNIYRATKLTYTDASDNFSYEFTSETTAPPFIGLFQNYNNFNVVFSVIIPKSEKYNKDYHQSFTHANGVNITSYENFDGHNDHYLIGPSIGALIHPDISLGMSLFYSHETRNYIQNIYTFPTDYPSTTQIWSNTYNEETTQEILGIFGIQWMPTLDWSFGAKINIPIQLSSTGTEQEMEVQLDHLNNQYSSKISTFTYNLRNMGFKSNYPTLGIGAAYLFSTKTLACLDINYLFGNSSASHFPSSSIVNVSFGFEHYVFPSFPFRLGAYTNASYFPKDQDGDHLNGMGFTASFGYESGANALNVAMDYQVAKGNTTSEGAITDHLDYSGITFLVSGSSNI